MNLCLSNDEKLLFSVCDSNIEIFNNETLVKIKTINENGKIIIIKNYNFNLILGEIHSICCSPNGNFFASWNS